MIGHCAALFVENLVMEQADSGECHSQQQKADSPAPGAISGDQPEGTVKSHIHKQNVF